MKIVDWLVRTSWLLMVGSQLCLAQTDSTARFDASEVVITGQYSPQAVDQAIHPVRIIGAQKMQQMAAVDLGDVLTNELNIRLSQDNILGQSLSIQGLSGENVKIMIDGVPIIGRQNGNLDLSQLNLLGIERIEIVEGPLSVNYGTNALAGTINLITRKSSQPGVEGLMNFYGEQVGTANIGGQFYTTIGKQRISLSLGRNFFDGWNEGEAAWPDFDRRLADTSRFQAWKPRTQLFSRLTLSRKIGKLDATYKGEVFDEVIINRGFPRAPYQEVAFDDRYHTRRFDNALTIRGQITEAHRINVITAYNDFTRWSNSYLKDLTTLEQTLVEVVGEQDTSSFGLLMSRGNLTSVREGARFNYELGYEINYETAQGQRIEDNLQSLGDYALFATAEWQPASWVVLRPGVRASYNTAYQAPIIPSLNVKANWGNLTARASYARGFRAPTLKELYFYFVDINHNIVGNPDLRAEYADNFSLNLRYKHLSDKGHLIQVEGNGFYNQLENLITLAQINSPEFTYINVAEFRSLGGQLKGSWKTENLNIKLGLSYTGRANQLDQFNEVPVFSFYPEANGNLSYRLKASKTTLSLFYKYQGRLPGFFINEEGLPEERFIAAYHTADANISQPLWDQKVRLALGAKNLLNVTNVQALLAGGVHSAGGSSVPVAIGRTLFIKLDIALDTYK